MCVIRRAGGLSFIGIVISLRHTNGVSKRVVRLKIRSGTQMGVDEYHPVSYEFKCYPSVHNKTVIKIIQLCQLFEIVI